jgi:hypothetical protein
MVIERERRECGERERFELGIGRDLFSVERERFDWA